MRGGAFHFIANGSWRPQALRRTRLDGSSTQLPRACHAGKLPRCRHPAPSRRIAGYSRAAEERTFCFVQGLSVP
eukprot:1013990-Pyramimonas_sp.AAC.1